jgi:hypothetical protein
MLTAGRPRGHRLGAVIDTIVDAMSLRPREDEFNPPAWRQDLLKFVDDDMRPFAGLLLETSRDLKFLS